MSDLRLDILTQLSDKFNNEQLKIIDNVIITLMANYDINTRCTEIQLYQNDGVPQEVKTFLVSKSIQGLTESSLRHYKRLLTHFVLNINKDIKIINANDIRLYLFSYEQTHKCCKSSIDDKRRVLSSFYSWLYKEDYIKKNPMLQIEPIKCDKNIREPLTMIQLEQMRNACETSREKAIFETLYSTGMRVSELTSINKSDIDFEKCRIKIFGKGKKERYVFLNAKSILAIKKYIFGRTDNSEALFVAGKKPFNRLGKGTIEKEISTIGIRANLNVDVFPHKIRHTFATNMLENGSKLSEVQAALGHVSSDTTLIYAKTNVNSLQAVHRRCII